MLDALPPTILVALFVAAALALRKLVPLVVQRYTSAVRNLPGPPSSHWLYGNLRDVFGGEVDSRSVVFEDWFAKYGHVVRFKGFLGVSLDPTGCTALQSLTMLDV